MQRPVPIRAREGDCTIDASAVRATLVWDTAVSPNENGRLMTERDWFLQVWVDHQPAPIVLRFYYREQRDEAARELGMP